jgi:hypothetical protein
LKTCKCGKANDPTRKFCIRCGASLIGIEDDTKEEVSHAQEPEPAPMSVQPGQKKTQTTTAGDKWVRPSQVAKDRMRTAKRHVEKTEFEKAQEAFAKTRSDEGDERMLRASEIRELMATAPDAAASPPRPAPAPASQPQGQPLGEPKAPTRAAPTGPPTSSTPIPQRTNAPQGTTRETRPPAGPPPGMPASMPAPPTMTKPPESVAPATAPPPKAVPPAMTQPPGAPASATPRNPVAPSARPVTSSAKAQPAIQPQGSPTATVGSGGDSKVRELDSDIQHYHQQIAQLEAEMKELEAKHDGERKWLNTVVETKRFRIESLKDEMETAKNEVRDAQKELRNAENRMKKEVEEAQKRIDNHAKNIKDAEKAREKRLKEIEKKSS